VDHPLRVNVDETFDDFLKRKKRLRNKYSGSIKANGAVVIAFACGAEDQGSNPARVQYFWGKHEFSVVYSEI
jgi:hypothetical protein